MVKNPCAKAGHAGDLGSILEWGRSPGKGSGNPLQYSCLENSMDKGAWWAVVHGAAKNRTHQSMHTCEVYMTAHLREPWLPCLNVGVKYLCLSSLETSWPGPFINGCRKEEINCEAWPELGNICNNVHLFYFTSSPLLCSIKESESESEVAQSCLTLCDPWTVAHQAPLSMGFSRQKYWSGLPFSSPKEGNFFYKRN